jgi:hypothetical protein
MSFTVLLGYDPRRWLPTKSAHEKWRVNYRSRGASALRVFVEVLSSDQHQLADMIPLLPTMNHIL